MDTVFRIAIAALLALAVGAAGGADEGADEGAWPAGVTELDVSVGHRVQVVGALRDGARIHELRLPPSCVKDVDKDVVGVRHALYGTTLPAGSHMTITVIPRGAAPIMLYAYAMPADRHDLPNDAAAASTCMSSVRAGPRNERLLTLTGGTAPHNVVIGVTSGGEAGTGRFLLAVDLR